MGVLAKNVLSSAHIGDRLMRSLSGRGVEYLNLPLRAPNKHGALYLATDDGILAYVFDETEEHLDCTRHLHFGYISPSPNLFSRMIEVREPAALLSSRQCAANCGSFLAFASQLLFRQVRRRKFAARSWFNSNIAPAHRI